MDAVLQIHIFHHNISVSVKETIFQSTQKYNPMLFQVKRLLNASVSKRHWVETPPGWNVTDSVETYPALSQNVPTSMPTIVSFHLYSCDD